MRISDWSSDVCTSDLLIPSLPMARARRRIAAGAAVQRVAAAGVADAGAGAGDPAAGPAQSGDVRDGARAQGERKSVVEGKRVSVRVDPGGRRNLKKKQQVKHVSLKSYGAISYD